MPGWCVYWLWEADPRASRVMHRDKRMNAPEMRTAIVSALRRLRAGGTELVRAVAGAGLGDQPRKGRSTPWFSIDVGQLSARMRPDVAYPAYTECHFGTDYAFIGERIPAVAVGSRFDDHRPYLTIALTIDNDRISNSERKEPTQFAAADLRSVGLGLMP
jgi:hypothetical protein